MRSVLPSTNHAALQGANRQKSVAFAHAHRHFTTQTRTARKKSPSYALASFYREEFGELLAAKVSILTN